MTNSHNRTNSHQAETSGQSSNSSSNSSGRFFANNSNAGKYAKSAGGSAKKQQQLNGSLNSSGRGYYNNQSQDGHKFFNDSNNDKFFVPLKGATSTPGKSRSSPQHRGSPTGTNGAAVLSQLSSSPPNLSHFAGSKCYDAPAPTALPKPPSHWTGFGPEVVMAMPSVPAATVPVPSPTKQQKQPSQAYYPKNGKGSGKAPVNKKPASPRQQHQQQHAHHNAMVSCGREFLMAAAANKTVTGDYDKFSENLKMVLNVRA